MNWLAENALIIWALGALALTMALVVYFQTGSRGSQYGILGVIVVTAILLGVEWYLETPREAVGRTIEEIVAAARDNDMPKVLSYISPSASQLRQDIESAMPLVTIERAAVIGQPLIKVELGTNPNRALVNCRVFIQGTLKRGGMRGGQPASCEVIFVQDGDRWLVAKYSADRDWRDALGR